MSTRQTPAPKNPLSRGAAALVIWALLTAACGEGGGGGQITNPPTTSPNSTAATTATSSSTSTTPTTTTATTVPQVPEPPTIELAGYTTMYSQDGHVRVRGMLDRTAEVAVGEKAADVYPDQYDGIATFETELALEPGEHAIPIMAIDSDGLRNEVILTVLVDPGLEVQAAMVEDVDLIGRTLIADYVEFLVGDEATIAAREDGEIGEDEETPGGFYLRNRNPKLRTLSLGDPGVVTVQACLPHPGPCVFEKAIDIDTWDDLRGEPEAAEGELGWFWYGAALSPYWLTMQDGVVVQIVELYLP